MAGEILSHSTLGACNVGVAQTCPLFQQDGISKKKSIDAAYEEMYEASGTNKKGPGMPRSPWKRFDDFVNEKLLEPLSSLTFGNTHNAN